MNTRAKSAVEVANPFDEVLHDLEGSPIMAQVAEGAPPKQFTVGHGITQILLAQDAGIDANEVVRRYSLAMQIHKRELVKLKAEDIVLLRRRIPELFPPIVAAQLLTAIGE